MENAPFCSIINCTSFNGALAVASGATANIIGEEITGNSASEGAGGIYNLGTTNISGRNISNNISNSITRNITNEGVLNITESPTITTTQTNRASICHNEGTLNLNTSTATIECVLCGIYLSADQYITLGTSLNKILIIYKDGLTTYDSNTGNFVMLSVVETSRNNY